MLDLGFSCMPSVASTPCHSQCFSVTHGIEELGVAWKLGYGGTNTEGKGTPDPPSPKIAKYYTKMQ